MWWNGRERNRGSSFVNNNIFKIAGLVYQKLSCTLEAGVDQLSMYWVETFLRNLINNNIWSLIIYKLIPFMCCWIHIAVCLNFKRGLVKVWEINREEKSFWAFFFRRHCFWKTEKTKTKSRNNYFYDRDCF